ncbi:DUF1127 domain-containing protein [Hasllibacter sp. MH4015]|uniref:DUF1127 domain-containing protein n=1 Tax=Hasllibacter sp. MH4015 TaxID=2854029 RepID=UPI001CD639FA|nr:DUF1127 domain-containing protein [Hasllibacter sp. MH4015]
MAHMPLTRRAAPPKARTAPTVSVAAVARLFRVWRQRQHLDRLPPHMRRDIGLSDAEVHREVGRPIWDVPHTWRL